MQEFLHTARRVEPAYQDILHIYRARVVSKPDPGDDRLQVRIIPHMADIMDTDTLPYYPPFFRNQVIVAKNERADKERADFVWVAALPDFTVGFVLGLATSYETSTQKFSASYNYKSVIDGLIQRGIASSQTSYENLFVQFWNDDYIEMIDTNSASAAKYFLLGNGTIIAMTSNQIYMRVGTKDKNGRDDFSAIRMSREEINLVTDHFRVKAKNITLGNKGLFVPGVMVSTPIATKGGSLHPQSHIRM